MHIITRQLRALVFGLSFLALPAWSLGAPTIMVFGDSLSAAYGLDTEQGWVAHLQKRLQAKAYPHQVLNLSVSGETTAGGLTRLPKALHTHSPALLILELGANDGLRGLNLAAMRANLRAMIEAAQARHAQVLLVGMRIPDNYGKTYTARFHGLYRELAEEYQLPWVEFLLNGIAEQPDLFQPDGLHPTAEAQEKLLENVWQVLEPMILVGSD